MFGADGRTCGEAVEVGSSLSRVTLLSIPGFTKLEIKELESKPLKTISCSGV